MKVRNQTFLFCRSFSWGMNSTRFKVHSSHLYCTICPRLKDGRPIARDLPGRFLLSAGNAICCLSLTEAARPHGFAPVEVWQCAARSRRRWPSVRWGSYAWWERRQWERGGRAKRQATWGKKQTVQPVCNWPVTAILQHAYFTKKFRWSTASGSSGAFYNRDTDTYRAVKFLVSNKMSQSARKDAVLFYQANSPDSTYNHNRICQCRRQGWLVISLPTGL